MKQDLSSIWIPHLFLPKEFNLPDLIIWNHPQILFLLSFKLKSGRMFQYFLKSISFIQYQVFILFKLNFKQCLILPLVIPLSLQSYVSLNLRPHCKCPLLWSHLTSEVMKHHHQIYLEKEKMSQNQSLFKEVLKVIRVLLEIYSLSV